MKTCRIKLEVELEIETFTTEDGVDLATEAVYDLEGLGITVLDVTVIGKSEQ